jgi:putative FmdB family regulatory protein
MPLYAYRCQVCGHQLEVRQRMSEEPLTECPVCQEAALRRVINQVGVMFRGSGFYVTDTKSSNPAAPGTAAEKGEGTAEKTPTTPPPAKEGKEGGESKAPAPSPTAAPANS